MFWREMSLVSLDTVNNHFLVIEHMGLEAVLRKKITCGGILDFLRIEKNNISQLRDFERKQFSHLQGWETT